MRGVSGSGKSTVADQMVGEGVKLSTDDFWGPAYEYDEERIAEAHMWNQDRSQSAMEKGLSPIVIDNTNTKAWEMKPYVEMAIRYGYQIEMMEPDTSWQFDVLALTQKNTHDVPREVIQDMVDGYEHDVTVDDVLRSKPPWEEDMLAVSSSWYRMAQYQFTPQEHNSPPEGRDYSSVFYGKLYEALQAKLSVNTNVNQVKQLLANPAKLGVSQDEIIWSGLGEWLELVEGKISRDDVLLFLSDNAFRIEEVQEIGERELEFKFQWDEGTPIEPSDDDVEQEAKDMYYEDKYYELESEAKLREWEESEHEANAMELATQMAYEALAENGSYAYTESEYGYTIAWDPIGGSGPKRNGEWSVSDDGGTFIESTEDSLEYAKEIAYDHAMEAYGKENPEPQYKNYAFPGGKNYQELLK